jgi:Aspartyl protease/PDZ domain
MSNADDSAAAVSRRHLLQTVAALALGRFGSVSASGERLQLASNAAPLNFDLIDNRIFVSALVEGQGPWHLVFDTGGSNILDLEVAQALKLPLSDGFEMPGAGAGRLPAWRTRVASVRLGPVTMHDTPFVVLPLAAIRRAIGLPALHGLVGHELLTRFRIGIDFIARTLTLAEPESPPLAGERRAGALVLPIEFAGSLPRIPARLDGREADLVIDSGDRSSLTLFQPYVEQHRLRQAYAARRRSVTGWGVGGPLLADLVRVRELVLAGLVLPGVTTRLPVGPAGVFSSRMAAGSIGGGVLRRLDVVFDHPRLRLTLAPNADLRRDDPADRSGLWLVQHDAGHAVRHVAEPGPGAEAGVVAGDIVLAVDGVPARELPLLALRERWMQPGSAGTRTLLSIRRADGRQVQIGLVLADPF